MRLASDGNAPRREIRMNELPMAAPLSRHSPALSVQALDHFPDLHNSKYYQSLGHGQCAERSGSPAPGQQCTIVN
jgi:hypothetical protein